MKQVFLVGILVAATFASKSQTLFTYGNNVVTKDEFLRAYNKNKQTTSNKEQALREYLELYTNFKLKVKAASEKRFDTLDHIKADVASFRLQVQDNYLSDEKALNELYNEAFNRSQRDLHVVHFSVPVLAGTATADTGKALQAINKISTALQSGKTNYQQIAEETNNITASKYADIGFITAFTLPYNYENIIYNLKPGQFSKPYRSKNAWHIFKLVEERQAAGKWKVAQILFSVPPGADENSKQLMVQKADSLYRALKSGADFSAAAQQFSDDKLTYQGGGELPEFGTGKFDQAFEKEVFKLNNDGDITQPFVTPYGIHIVKRLSHTKVSADKNDVATAFEIKQKIQKDSRIEAARNRFAKQIMAKTALKKLSVVKDTDLFRYADSALANPDMVSAFPINKKPILQFKNKTVNASDWLLFVVKYKGNPESYKGENNAALWERYTTFAAVEYYKEHMEDYNNDFRFQMREFEEGNMLFEVMEKNIWGKASEDSAGLLKYYTANKTKYKWGPSADVLIFNCGNAATADAAFMAIKKGTDWRNIAEEYTATLQVDSGRYELNQIIGTDFVQSPTGNSYSPLVKNADGTAAFVKYLNIYPGNEQREFEEAKGLVINDYQFVLEELWLKELRKKYPVKLNEPVLQSLLK